MDFGHGVERIKKYKELKLFVLLYIRLKSFLVPLSLFLKKLNLLIQRARHVFLRIGRKLKASFRCPVYLVAWSPDGHLPKQSLETIFLLVQKLYQIVVTRSLTQASTARRMSAECIRR